MNILETKNGGSLETKNGEFYNILKLDKISYNTGQVIHIFYGRVFSPHW